ncbi:uncharacterized protein LOC122509762 [Leptopilina heterotoma]|uniref:uncharacterized protein LOC122509762 n=1 Tax=Leptopilina heterotoma TaxID=63436 RepID=UPI001CA8AFC1|nr:uncharacterized protein LOC122509762 [Leptopilina heterotoma]
MESKKITESRRYYLMQVQKFRDMNWSIFFTDESWCGANHTLSYGWIEQVLTEYVDNYDIYRSGVQKIGNYRGGFVTPSGAGKRVILLHIGNEDGFLPNCMKCFIGKKGSADYHGEMNALHYEEWFRDVLMKVPKNSVIVLDQAPYHTMLDPNFRNVTTAWKKSDIIDWLIKKGVNIPESHSSFCDMKRNELYQLSQQFRYPKVYLLDTIAQEVRNGEVKLLWLPVAHCELNPIELIWAFIKKRVAATNKTFKIQDVLELCKEIMSNLPPNLWKNCVRHAKEIENEYRGRHSAIMEAIPVQEFIINIGDDSEEDFSDNEDSFEDTIVFAEDCNNI